MAVVPGMSLEMASQFFVSRLEKSDDAISVFKMRSRVTPTLDDGSMLQLMSLSQSWATLKIFQPIHLFLRAHIILGESVLALKRNNIK